MDCVFCGIAAGEIPSAELGSNQEAFAFLDINPLRPGHALVIARTCAAKHADLPPSVRAGMWELVADMTPKLCAAVGAPDATIGIHDGPSAGQEIPHCHVHVVPRRSGDGGKSIHGLFSGTVQMTPDDLHDIAVQVQA